MSLPSEADGVRIAIDGPILRVTLCAPEVLNAQTPGTWARLAAVPAHLDERVRLVVVEGQGRSFSAGLDRRMLTAEGIAGQGSLAEVARGDDAAIDAFIRRAQAGFTWQQGLAVPVVAYVHGHAIGAGFQLALAADIVIVAPDARFAMRETGLGLVPDLGGTAPLVRSLGYQGALEACLTGREIDAIEAVRRGLALEMVEHEDWPEHQARLAGGLASLLPGAVADLKALLRGLVDAGPQLERERVAQAGRLRDVASRNGTPAHGGWARTTGEHA